MTKIEQVIQLLNEINADMIEAQKRMPHAHGISRVPGNPQAVHLYFGRDLSDDDIRFIHGVLR